jgi:hypothetical protein
MIKSGLDILPDIFMGSNFHISQLLSNLNVRGDVGFAFRVQQHCPI